MDKVLRIFMQWILYAYYVSLVATTIDLTATPYLQTFVSHDGWDGTSTYPGGNYTRDWLITGETANYTITINILHCGIESYKGVCIDDNLYIYDGSNSSASLLEKTCCVSPFVTTFGSTDGTMYILFETDDKDVDTGFKISYILEGAPTSTVSTTTLVAASIVEDDDNTLLYIYVACGVTGFLLLIIIILICCICCKKKKKSVRPHSDSNQRLAKKFNGKPRPVVVTSDSSSIIDRDPDATNHSTDQNHSPPPAYTSVINKRSENENTGNKGENGTTNVQETNNKQTETKRALGKKNTAIAPLVVTKHNPSKTQKTAKGINKSNKQLDADSKGQDKQSSETSKNLTDRQTNQDIDEKIVKPDTSSTEPVLAFIAAANCEKTVMDSTKTNKVPPKEGDNGKTEHQQSKENTGHRNITNDSNVVPNDTRSKTCKEKPNDKVKGDTRNEPSKNELNITPTRSNPNATSTDSVKIKSEPTKTERKESTKETEKPVQKSKTMTKLHTDVPNQPNEDAQREKRVLQGHVTNASLVAESKHQSNDKVVSTSKKDEKGTPDQLNIDKTPSNNNSIERNNEEENLKDIEKSTDSGNNPSQPKQNEDKKISQTSSNKTMEAEKITKSVSNKTISKNESKHAPVIPSSRQDSVLSIDNSFEDSAFAVGTNNITNQKSNDLDRNESKLLYKNDNHTKNAVSIRDESSLQHNKAKASDKTDSKVRSKFYTQSKLSTISVEPLYAHFDNELSEQEISLSQGNPAKNSKVTFPDKTNSENQTSTDQANVNDENKQSEIIKNSEEYKVTASYISNNNHTGEHTLTKNFDTTSYKNSNPSSLGSTNSSEKVDKIKSSSSRNIYNALNIKQYKPNIIHGEPRINNESYIEKMQNLKSIYHSHSKHGKSDANLSRSVTQVDFDLSKGPPSRRANPWFEELSQGKHDIKTDRKVTKATLLHRIRNMGAEESEDGCLPQLIPKQTAYNLLKSRTTLNDEDLTASHPKVLPPIRGVPKKELPNIPQMWMPS